MVFPIAGGTQDTGYEISNSLRFNDDDNAYLARTPSSTGSRTIATVSFWVKRGNLTSKNYFMLEASSSTSPFNMTRVRFDSDDYLVIDNTLNGSADNGFMFQSSAKYRDISAWYHIFFSVDVTQANATDGWLLYVNGVQQTKALSYWVQNANLEWSQSGVQMNVGRRHDNTSNNFDGYLAEYHYIDGTRKLYTDFGEFNDNGVWIPKKYTGGSYGTNGFYFKFDQTGTGTNSSGMGADSSGNDNHFAPNNLAAIDVTTDTCTNNFATINPLASIATLSEGNCKVVTTNGERMAGASTIGFENGKWYMEYKVTDINSTNMTIGIDNESGLSFSDFRDNDDFWNASNAYAYENNGNKRTTSVNSSYGNSYTTGDIIGVAVDMDNRKIYFSKNGTYQNSGDPTTGSTGTGSAFDLTDGLTYFFQAADNSSAAGVTLEANFGNPTFSISSGNADSEGHGNFEYAPPSGYFALCTKNLAEYG
jgi:hypothetical protein